MPNTTARPTAVRASAAWTDRLRAWLRRDDDDEQPIPEEVHADVHAYLGERRAQLGHWFFLTRLGLALGLVLYLMIDAVLVGAAAPAAAVLLVGYALANLGVRFLCGRAAACAPYGYALVDLSAIVLLRHALVFETVVDPNATMVGLFVLVLISYTLYANPKLGAGLSLATLAATALTIHFGPALGSAPASALGAAPFQAFLLVEYLSIACLVTCLVALRLRRQVVGHSVEMHRRMQAAIASATERARRERVEEVDRLKRDFIAVLSHELRGPITPLCTALEIVAEEMRHGRTDPEMLEIATDSAGVLRRLICDYTHLAELMMQHDADAPRWNIPLRVLLDTLLADVDGERFGVEAPDELAVSSDPYLLRGALLAILRRAELKTPAGQHATVSTCVEEDGGIVISVHDPASCLSPEESASLDDPFAASSERVFFSANSGLELILAQHALRRIGGRLAIESVPEGGTAIRCTLPGPQDELRWLQPKQLETLGL